MKRIPKYGKHKATGLARVWIDGRHVYLGKFGTKQSRLKYARLLAENSTTPVVPDNTEYTVNMLAIAFWKANKGRYYKNGQPTSEHRSYKTAFKPVLELYGDTPASEFGPRALIACRARLVDKGYCRKRINGHVYRIRKAWKWAVSQEIVPETTWRALLSVECLKYGEAPETEPIRPVPTAHVDAILPYVTNQIRTMIQLQLHTAARPGEVCSLKTGDISMRGDVWEFLPGSHKTQHHGKRRVILIGPRAQKILRPWLKPDLQAHLFVPREAKQAWLKRVRKRTPKVKSNGKQRMPGEFYTTVAYGHAIQKACHKAGIPAWSPNRLRHSSATAYRDKYGVEVTKIILGHASINTTELYAERDLSAVRAAVREVG